MDGFVTVESTVRGSVVGLRDVDSCVLLDAGCPFVVYQDAADPETVPLTRVVPTDGPCRDDAEARVVVFGEEDALVSVSERLQQCTTVCGEAIAVVAAALTVVRRPTVAVVRWTCPWFMSELRHLYVLPMEANCLAAVVIVSPRTYKSRHYIPSSLFKRNPPFRDERTARGNVILVPDPMARRRPKGESDSDDPELPSQWPRQHNAGGKPATPDFDEKGLTHKTVTRLPEPDKATGKGASVKVAAMRPKLATQKRHPLLRPDEQKPDTGKASKTSRGKREYRYAKARKAHQRQGRR